MKILKNVLGNSLYSAFINVFIFVIFWILGWKLKFLTIRNDIVFSILFEICLLVLFSICYFLLFKISMSKEFIKNFVSRFSFLLFIGCATWAFIHVNNSTYHYGIIDKLLGSFLISFLYVFPSIIICVLTLIIINKMFYLYKKFMVKEG